MAIITKHRLPTRDHVEISVFGPVVLQLGSVVLSMALSSAASKNEDHISLGVLFAKPGTASKPSGSQSTQVSKGKGRKDLKSKSDKDGNKKEKKRKKKGDDEGDEDKDRKGKKKNKKEDHKGAEGDDSKQENRKKREDHKGDEDDDRKGKKSKKKEEHKSDDESGTEASTEGQDEKSGGVLHDDTQEQWIREMGEVASADEKKDTETQGDNVDERDGTEKAEQLRVIAESRARMDAITAPTVALFKSREVPQDAPSDFGLGSISAASPGDFSLGGKTAITPPFALCPSHRSPNDHKPLSLIFVWPVPVMTHH